jgi:uncharacterized protein GlcG (DUF336 family)
VKSSDFGRNRQDIREEMDQVDGLLVLDGGVPIRAADSLVGALGVTGTPGGDKDESCAAAAVKGLQDRLDFVD